MIIRLKYSAEAEEQIFKLTPENELCAIGRLRELDGLVYYGIIRYDEQVEEDYNIELGTYALTFVPIFCINPNNIIYIRFDSYDNEEIIHDLNSSTTESELAKAMHEIYKKKNNKFQRFSN